MKPISFLLFLGAIFFSCQKEITADSASAPGAPSINDSSYISEITWKDSATMGNIVKIQRFQYDNLKRLSSTTIFTQYDTTTYSFYYSNNDTLATKFIKTSITLTGPSNNLIQKDTTVLFYYFDPLRRRIRDSLIIYSHPYVAPSYMQLYTIGLSIRKYSYNGNKIYGIMKDTTLLRDIFTPVYPADIYYDTATVDGNDNILSSNFINSSGYYEKTTFTYDSKPCGFTTFKKMRPLYLPYNMDMGSYDLHWSDKNVVKLEVENGYSGGAPFNFLLYDFTNLYNYNTNNLPVKINSSVSNGFVILFKYVSL